MAANFALCPSLAPASTACRIPHKKTIRSSLPLCKAKKSDQEGLSNRLNLGSHDFEKPGLSASIVATLAGVIVLADTNAAIAAQGDIYDQLGIPQPTGSGGVVLSTPQKKSTFQGASSAQQSSKKAETKVTKSVTAPEAKAPPPKPAPKKPAPKLKLAPKVQAPSIKVSKEAPKKTSKPSPDVKAAGGGFSLPKIELPSLSAPSLPSASVSDSGKQQALAVAGIEVVLVVITSSIVGSLFSKKSRA